MTVRYIRWVRKQHAKCSQCKSKPADDRKLCAKHLAQARTRFRIWSAKRRAAGLCISCDRKGFTGELRCKHHKKISTMRCRQWMQDHPEYTQQYYAKRKKMTLETGKCYVCSGTHGQRNPIVPGRLRCMDCLYRAKIRDRSRA